MAPTTLIPHVTDEMNLDDDDEDPSQDVEARAKRPKLMSDEEETVPAHSGGGLSCAAVTQAENMDAESSATCSAIAYQHYEDMSNTSDDSDFSVKDDENYYKPEAIRLLNFTKMLFSLDSVDFYGWPPDLLKELEMKGLIPPNYIGAQKCIRLMCNKFHIVHYYDAQYNLVKRLLDLAPYMQWNDEIGEQVEWLKEKDYLTSLQF